MATSRNDITGDSLRSRSPSEEYRNNYDAIFGKKKKDIPQEGVPPESKDEEVKAKEDWDFPGEMVRKQ